MVDLRGLKKDDKWYYEDELDKKEGVKSKTKGISEEEAIERVRSGKNVYTIFEKLAQNLVEKVSKLNRADRIAKRIPVSFSSNGS